MQQQHINQKGISFGGGNKKGKLLFIRDNSGTISVSSGTTIDDSGNLSVNNLTVNGTLNGGSVTNSAFQTIASNLIIFDPRLDDQFSPNLIGSETTCKWMQIGDIIYFSLHIDFFDMNNAVNVYEKIYFDMQQWVPNGYFTQSNLANGTGFFVHSNSVCVPLRVYADTNLTRQRVIIDSPSTAGDSVPNGSPTANLDVNFSIYVGAD